MPPQSTVSNIYEHITYLTLKAERLENIAIDVYKQLETLEKRLQLVEGYLTHYNEVIINRKS